jgi:hypothetical protein
VPVIVFTSSVRAADRDKTFALGANFGAREKWPTSAFQN